MLKRLKKVSLGMSMVAALVVAPISLQAGVGEGLSESSSAAMESPNFEHQLVRINTGINYIRISYDIMLEMPISEDAEWADLCVRTMDKKMVTDTLALDDVKNDAYFSTVMITNLILRRPVPPMSPAIIRLYYVASVIYKNKANSYILDEAGEKVIGSDGKAKQNGNQNYHIPDFNEFPDVTNLDTFVKFKKDSKVSLIKVEAKNGNSYTNVAKAIIALLPDSLQDKAKESRAELLVAREEVASTKGEVAVLEVWLDDEKNAGSPDIADKKEGLEVAKKKNEMAEKVYDEKEDIYFSILDQGALQIEADFDVSKVPLAKKVDNLLGLVDDGAINAGSLFTAAMIGIYRGLGEYDKELKAILVAQALTTLVGNQKQFLIERYKRMLVGTLMAIPNIAVGSYYLASGRGAISTYKDVVGAVLDGAEAQEEAAKAAAEAAKVQEAEEAAKAPSTETK